MNYNLTVNALLTVKAFPCITNVKKPTTATRIGDRIHKSENKTEFIRATDIISDRSKGWGRGRTFDEPLQLYSPRIHCTLDPLILPREELDKLDLYRNAKSSNIIPSWSKKEERTAPTNSFITAIRLSLLVEVPFWILILRFMINELRGHPTTKTRKPAKADQPRH